MTMDAEQIRNIVGVVGNIISFVLFAAPVCTFIGIYKKKSVQEFQPYPYLATVMNCCMWIFYGIPLVHPDSLLVVTINGIGLAMELGYLSLYFFYGPKKRNQVLLILLGIAIVVAGIATGVLEGLHTHNERSEVVGIICVVFGIIMYSSPLFVMRKVIKTRSVEFMPLYLSLASFSNGLVWTAYALLKFDLFILIANGSGAIVGAVQLFLYWFYHNTPESKAAKKGEMPISTKGENTDIHQ